MNTDQDLANLMRRATDGLHPPLEQMVEAGGLMGRRLRRRRHRQAGIAAALSVVMITAVGYEASHRPGDNASHVAEIRPSIPALTHPGDDPPPASLHTLLQSLRALLPAGATLATVGTADLPGGRTLIVNYDDGGGASTILVSVYNRQTTPPACPTPPLIDQIQRPAGAPAISCTVNQVGSGREMVAVTATDHDGLYDYQVRLERPDGVEVTMKVTNGTRSGSAPVVTRRRPPLTLPQMAAIVASPLWQPPAGGDNTTPPPPAPSHGSTHSTPPAPAGCVTGNLTLRQDASEGAAGTQHSVYSLTNTSTSACTLRGFPGVSFLDAAGQQIGPDATRATYIGTPPAGTVALHPGESGTFLVTTVNVVPSPDCPVEADTTQIRVYPPNQNTPLQLTIPRLNVCDPITGLLRPNGTVGF